MDKDELGFKKRKLKINEFKTELKTLMDKYNFGKHESHNYDGNDEYCGTDYHFTIDDVPWYSETIYEILHEAIGLH